VTKLFVRVKLKARGERNRCIRRFDIESTWLVKSATHHQLYAALVWLQLGHSRRFHHQPAAADRQDQTIRREFEVTESRRQGTRTGT